MVVDDAMIIREMVKDAAAEAGWEIVAEAADGQEAVEKYLLFEPDAVTLDLVMPEFDGLHALRGIMQYNPNAKVLVLSALDQKTILQEAFKIGAADFLVKPFESVALQESLDRLIEQRQNALK